MLDELRRRGVLDHTIVIVTSDHGEQFGEHGLRLHANSLYLPLLHVPLVIRYPARVTQGASGGRAGEPARSGRDGDRSGWSVRRGADARVFARADGSTAMAKAVPFWRRSKA